MLTYLTTNLFSSPAQALVNTVNTVGVMGKGLALQFKKLYPAMYQEYRKRCKAGQLQTGQLHIYRTAHKTIINFPTKQHWRGKSRLEWIETGLETFVNRYIEYGIASVSFPQLGCGNGELDWSSQIQPVMEQYLKDLPIPVYVHIYRQDPNFVPERLTNGNDIHQERQPIPFSQVWHDLQTLSPPTLSDRVHLDEEAIQFILPTGQTFVVYRQDIEDLWSTLRLQGTIGDDTVPEPIRADGATHILFEFLTQLPYVEPVALYTLKRPVPTHGLQYTPPPRTELLAPAEILL
ncbi:macro domain-containing protein [Anaerolineales bacterium HSG6]|nr:macro domain-containing protein [Anaerolineales bacterium HSG6]